MRFFAAGFWTDGESATMSSTVSSATRSPEEDTMPEAFLWGTATSAHQVEGYNTASDWWHWETLGHIDRGESSGAACDHRNRFREDLRLVADLGMNSYRFSIEWARIEPSEGRWDASALDWYEALISECERLGLMPVATLHHFTLPHWVAERGGLIWPEFAERFDRYVTQVVGKLGARIPMWCTFNEPVNLAVGSYLGGYMPPALRSARKTSLAIRHLIRAHRLAYARIHGQSSDSRRGPWKEFSLRVGIAHNMLDVQPYHFEEQPASRVERVLARQIDRFYNWSMLDALCGRPARFRIPFLIPEVSRDVESDRPCLDFLGVNFYTRLYVSLTPIPGGEPGGKCCLNFGFSRPGVEASDLGWEFAPAGFARILRGLAGYSLPIYITENGLADAEDVYRKRYVREHLLEVAEAITSGIDIRGYFYWSVLDNFEWIKGFAPRFGLYGVDYQTQERTIRPSAEWLRDVIRIHRERGFFPDRELL